MQPSSLILLAIVVVWAAYLVPQWVRRRDEMSQSRAGDRFSGGLRVLKRRERTSRSGRSGDPLLTSPRVIVDTDGELLYIPADRLLSERLTRSSLSLPQSAQPGETLIGVAVDGANAGEPSTWAATVDGADPEDDVPTAPVRQRDADTVFDRAAEERPGTSANDVVAGDVVADGGPTEHQSAATVVEAGNGQAGNGQATEESPIGDATAKNAEPESAPAKDELSDLEAGLLAGFGLTAPTAPAAPTVQPSRQAQAEAMPTVQPPAATGMSDLEAGLLAGFGLAGRAEGEPFVETPRARRTPSDRPRRRPVDFVPGTESVPHSGSRAPQAETAWVVEPQVTTSSPVSASAEAAQASYQSYQQALADSEEAPGNEYTTTHADLDAARLSARVAASRRARSMAVLLIATIAAWVFSVTGAIPVFVPIAATLLLSAHAVASRTAAVRSRETLTMLAAHLYAAEMAREHAEKRRRQAAARTRARAEAEAAPVPERVAKRAAAVSSDTWDPIPVPPPTYQLKPAVHRPPPPPLELPDEQPARKPAASSSERQVSRGSMPRRAADIERILKLDQDAERRRAVNE